MFTVYISLIPTYSSKHCDVVFFNICSLFTSLIFLALASCLLNLKDIFSFEYISPSFDTLSRSFPFIVLLSWLPWWYCFLIFLLPSDNFVFCMCQHFIICPWHQCSFLLRIVSCIYRSSLYTPCFSYSSYILTSSNSPMYSSALSLQFWQMC